MAVGWAGDNAVNDQIDATVDSEVSRIRSSMNSESSITCVFCLNTIPEARRRALRGVNTCFSCASRSSVSSSSSYNRRGSKDSQLR